MWASPKTWRSSVSSPRRRRTSGKGSGRRRTMSQSASIPPGRRTRAHSETSRSRAGMRWDDSRTHTRSKEASGKPLSVPSRISNRTRSPTPAAVARRGGGFDADGAGGDPHDSCAVVTGQRTGRCACAAADVEHLDTGSDPRRLRHALGEGLGRLRQGLGAGLEEPVVQIVTEQWAPGGRDPVVVAGRVVARVGHGRLPEREGGRNQE